MLRIPIHLYFCVICVMCLVVFGLRCIGCVAFCGLFPGSLGLSGFGWRCFLFFVQIFFALHSVGFGILMWYGTNMVMALLYYL